MIDINHNFMDLNLYFCCTKTVLMSTMKIKIRIVFPIIFSQVN